MDYLGEDPVATPIRVATPIKAMVIEGRSVPVYNTRRPPSTPQRRLQFLNVALKKELMSGISGKTIQEVTGYAAHEDVPHLNPVARFLVQQLVSTPQGQQVLLGLLSE